MKRIATTAFFIYCEHMPASTETKHAVLDVVGSAKTKARERRR